MKLRKYFPHCTRYHEITNKYRLNAKYLQFDWLKQHIYFWYLLIATVQISMEYKTQDEIYKIFEFIPV